MLDAKTDLKELDAAGHSNIGGDPVTEIDATRVANNSTPSTDGDDKELNEAAPSAPIKTNMADSMDYKAAVLTPLSSPNLAKRTISSIANDEDSQTTPDNFIHKEQRKSTPNAKKDRRKNNKSPRQSPNQSQRDKNTSRRLNYKNQKGSSSHASKGTDRR